MEQRNIEEEPEWMKRYEIPHNHNRPEDIEHADIQNCPGCKAIGENLQPSEDGFYQYEEANKLFMTTYDEIFDKFESEGRLIEYKTEYGIMFDNFDILKETRLRVKLRNPNHSTD